MKEQTQDFATHLNIRLRGDIRGVFFPRAVRSKAQRLGLNGFIRDADDDAMYLEIEGSRRQLHEFLEWCRVGPHLFAKVDEVVATEDDPKDLTGFEIFAGEEDNRMG